MKKKPLVTIFALGILGTPMLAQAQGAYDYESVTYPGSTFDQLWGINQRGDVAGNGFVRRTVCPTSTIRKRVRSPT